MLHMDLIDPLVTEFGEALTAMPELCRDALLIQLDNGVGLEVRYPAPGEYAFAWRWGEAELRIDTAPVHPGLATFPQHLHDAAGLVRAAPCTHPDQSPWDNLRAVLEAVLRDPLLERA